MSYFLIKLYLFDFGHHRHSKILCISFLITVSECNFMIIYWVLKFKWISLGWNLEDRFVENCLRSSPLKSFLGHCDRNLYHLMSD